MASGIKTDLSLGRALNDLIGSTEPDQIKDLNTLHMELEKVKRAMQIFGWALQAQIEKWEHR